MRFDALQALNIMSAELKQYQNPKDINEILVSRVNTEDTQFILRVIAETDIYNCQFTVTKLEMECSNSYFICNLKFAHALQNIKTTLKKIYNANN